MTYISPKPPPRQLHPRTRLLFACIVAFIASPCIAQVLWYGGDGDPSLTLHGLTFYNNTIDIQGADTFGYRVIDDFVMPPGRGWHVNALFSNNVTFNVPSTQAEWSIRTGVAAGMSGTIVARGISPVTISPTGRVYANTPEYMILVSGLSLDLSPGTYFVAVSPIAAAPMPIDLSNFYSMPVPCSNANSVGLPGPNGVFLEARNNPTAPPFQMLQISETGRASMGIIGAVIAPPIPALSGLGYALLVAAISLIGIVTSKSAT